MIKLSIIQEVVLDLLMKLQMKLNKFILDKKKVMKID